MECARSFTCLFREWWDELAWVLRFFESSTRVVVAARVNNASLACSNDVNRILFRDDDVRGFVDLLSCS